MLVGIYAAIVIAEARGQTANSHDDLLQRGESRFRAIYERNEYRPRPFQAEWLPNGSGYTIMEPAPGAMDAVSSFVLVSPSITVMTPLLVVT